MCGILACYNRHFRPIDIEAFVAANNLQKHRGPDSEGYLLVNTRDRSMVACKGNDAPKALALPHVRDFFSGSYDLALGHRRLAIIDVHERGHQPMQSASSEIAISYNGEVYNYIELRQELVQAGYKFKTNTDTEVVLNAYQHWGENCFERFNGMWGCVILDMRNGGNKLTISRDRFGIKPLCYSDEKNRLIFSSEFSPIIKLSEQANKLNAKWGAAFLSHGLSPRSLSGESYFDSIMRVSPATNLSVDEAGISKKRYWSINHSRLELNSTEVVEQISSLLDSSVSLRLRSDVPVGSCLSGGIDSSAIVSRMSRHQDTEMNFSTFTAVYEEQGRFNEKEYAELIASQFNMNPVWIYPSVGDLSNVFERFVLRQEEPVEGSNYYAQWCVMDHVARSGVKVLLDGQGADEIFGGYEPQIMVELYSARSAGNYSLRRARLEYLILRRWLWKGFRSSISVFPPWISDRLSYLNSDFLASIPHEMMKHALGDTNEALSLEKRLRYQTEDLSLERLLHHEDRNSMAHGIEARVPFTDYRIVEFAFRQAQGWKLHDGWTKWLLRKAIAGVVPDKVVWNKQKVGFETPEYLYVRHLLKERVIDSNSKISNLIDLKEFQLLRENILAQRNVEASSIRKAWRTLCFDCWLDTFNVDV